jgi:hypothetical protein
MWMLSNPWLQKAVYAREGFVSTAVEQLLEVHQPLVA